MAFARSDAASAPINVPSAHRLGALDIAPGAATITSAARCAWRQGRADVGVWEGVFAAVGSVLDGGAGPGGGNGSGGGVSGSPAISVRSALAPSAGRPVALRRPPLRGGPLRAGWCGLVGLAMAVGLATSTAHAAKVCPAGATVYGTDVSSWQGAIDFDAVAASGVKFVITRIGDGLYHDPYFESNWQAILDVGLIRGAYLFYEPTKSASAQAKHVVDSVGKLGAGDLPVTLDVEWTTGTPTASAIQTFVDLVTAGTGKTPMIYTAAGYWNQYFTSQFGGLKLWVANWETSCPTLPSSWSSWVFWQTGGGSGSIPGIAGGVDEDVFNGSEAALEAFATGCTASQCAPGQKQTQACGSCGTRTRTCGSACTWGAWSGCSGQGPCAPGATQSAGCGQCGTHTRTCTSGCAWDGWSACTGEGACAAGQTESRPCGSCGTQSRVCSDACDWGGWGACAGEGPCAPGATELGTCGNCGQRERSCTPSCAWSEWSGCDGERDCAPGTVDSAPCGDCGTHARTCGSDCLFGTFGACTGAEPAVHGACQSTADGACRAGHWQCLGGTTTCRPVASPTPEVCNGVDDDCNGLVDDNANAMGATPPALAASLDAVLLPDVLVAGEPADLRVTFRNVGTQDWPPDSMWIVADGPGDGTPSPLRAPIWAAGTLVARLPAGVPTGHAASVLIPVLAPPTGGQTVTEVFRLASADQGLLRCPSPWLAIALDVVPPDGRPGSGPDGTATADPPPAAAEPAADADTGDAAPHIGVWAGRRTSGGCTTGRPPAGPVPAWLVLVALLLLAGARRRPRRSVAGGQGEPAPGAATRRPPDTGS